MLYDKLKNYAKSGVYPFHMPGHKRNDILSDKTIPYNIDITEIEDFDNLHSAEGCIKEIEDFAADLYSVKRAFLLVNGATGGLLASVRALTNYSDKIIMSRNCHKSVYNAVELCGLNPVYIIPEINNNLGIFSSIKPCEVEKLLSKNTDAKLVVITSPTYEGVVSDIKSISEICKKYGVKLLVDEAHGAHFPFSNKFPYEAVNSGADVAVVSLHKTLPSLTQTALLLTNDIDLEECLSENLSVFETSSPSYIFMSSIGKSLEFINKNRDRFNSYTELLVNFYKKTKVLKNLSLFYSNKELCDEFFDYDIGKIIISTQNTDINGVELANILRNRFKIETEMAYADYVLAMTSVCDTKEGFDRLNNALKAIDRECNPSENSNNIFIANKHKPKSSFTPSQKFKYKPKEFNFINSNGRVSLEYVWAYPPGIPIIVPGEVITEEVITEINYLSEKGVNLYSTKKKMPSCITVAEID